MENIYIFDATIKEIKPQIRRRFAVKGNTTLEEFSGILLLGFGWEISHLWVYEIGDKEYGLTDEDSGDVIEESEVKIKDFDKKMLKKFTFTYDFGDNWEHDIKLVDIVPPEKGKKYPSCLAGARSCPPEDCGSVDGYYEIVEAIKFYDEAISNKNILTERQKELLSWMNNIWPDRKYDPEEFDLEKTNKAISKAKKFIKECKSQVAF
jgi:hypothetical protein